MTTAATSIVSAGAAAQNAGASVSRVLKAAEALRITPELAIDRVPYFTETDSERIADYLNRKPPSEGV